MSYVPEVASNIIASKSLNFRNLWVSQLFKCFKISLRYLKRWLMGMIYTELRSAVQLCREEVVSYLHRSIRLYNSQL